MSSIIHAQNMVYLDTNNIRAGFYPGGVLFAKAKNDTLLGLPAYEVPKGDGLSIGVHAIESNSFWLSGLDQNNNLVGAATILSTVADWSAGPISNVYDAQYDSLYKQVFKVSKVDIDYHRSHYTVPGYIVPDAINKWPGNGRVALGEASPLAPFVDINHNGIYEPILGDYPDVLGDQAVLLFLKDVSSASTSFCSNMGVEMRIMGYAFHSADTILDNTVFLNIKVSNRSQLDFHDVYFSNVMNPEIGCYSDDAIGCDSASSSSFAYNRRTYDPSSCNTGQLGYGIGWPFQFSAFLCRQMTSSLYFEGINSNPSGYPRSCHEYRNYQLGLFRNGTPNKYGGNGYNGTGHQTNYCFSDSAWTVMNSSTSLSPNFYSISSVFLDTLKANQSKEVDMAFISSFCNGGCGYGYPTNELKDVLHVQNLFKQQIKSCNTNVTGIAASSESSFVVNLYPNPTNGKVTVKLPKLMNEAQLQLMSIHGQEIQQINTTSSETVLNLSGLAKGVYLLKIQSGENTSVKRIVVE